MSAVESLRKSARTSCSNCVTETADFACPVPKASHSGEHPKTRAIRTRVESRMDLVLPRSTVQISDGETPHWPASSTWFIPARIRADRSRPPSDAGLWGEPTSLLRSMPFRSCLRFLTGRAGHAYHDSNRTVYQANRLTPLAQEAAHSKTPGLRFPPQRTVRVRAASGGCSALAALRAGRNLSSLPSQSGNRQSEKADVQSPGSSA